MLKITVTIISLAIVKKFIRDREKDWNLEFNRVGFQFVSLMFISIVDSVIRTYM